MTQIPVYDEDLFDDEGITNPHRHYKALRELGPVVYLRKQEVYALPRFAEVREALIKREVFISGRGVGFAQIANEAVAGNTLCSDPPLHGRLRKLLNACLLPRPLEQFKEQFNAQAEALVKRVVAVRSFDGVKDFATFIPTSIVSTLVGLPEYGREHMLDWAAGAFNVLGPENELLRSAIPDMQAAISYASNPDTHAQLKPGSWAHSVREACEAGEISEKELSLVLLDFIGPSLDTTINATSNLLWLFGQDQEQWKLLCSEPTLVKSAINEVLRIEAPIRGFTRYVADDYRFGDFTLPKASRVFILYASANRDERKWTDPDRFDITRAAVDQLSFGMGAHMCAGQHLAKLEITALLNALIRHVERFSVSNPVWFRNNLLRGLRSFDVTIG